MKSNNKTVLAQDVPNTVARIETRMSTTGALRSFLANIALAVAQGEIKVAEAVVAVKACEQINASLYSEVKIAALQAISGKKAAPLGDLSLFGGDDDDAQNDRP